MQILGLAFRELSTALGCTPDEVAYIGDDPEVDAIAATNSGFFGIWLNRNNQERPIEVKTEIRSLTTVKSFLNN